LLFVVAIVNLNVVPTIAANGGVYRLAWLWHCCSFLAAGHRGHRAGAPLSGEGGVYLWAKRVFGDFHGFALRLCYWTNNIFYVRRFFSISLAFRFTSRRPRARTLADNPWFALGASMVLPRPSCCP